MNIVISQSMLFPWVGMLEQVRLADIYVHYDDVQFSKGSLVNRVQVKMPQGTRWMTVPLKGLHLGQAIQDVSIADDKDWRSLHLRLLHESFASAPFKEEALSLVESVYAERYTSLAALSRASLLALVKYFSLDQQCQFLDVTSLNIPGSSTDRVFDIVRHLSGDTYITGHGARAYLEHERFAAANVNVAYMNYQRTPYPQSHGVFTPYVTGLDLVAHCGKKGVDYIHSESIDWREFLQ
ncbi:WbqC [Pokkaliibacter plantistimulans]|uniref:WbqC n=1 Tax=Pokkaliibacter plantistimulans TaxID=1635171 RepID=A0ABX5M3X7_9GAMM|nr:WbqC family protein [Pokkaliibacter plantistimulans]PXF32373.1 WbqC [Pokkaliibacter plantistimulans]